MAPPNPISDYENVVRAYDMAQNTWEQCATSEERAQAALAVANASLALAMLRQECKEWREQKK
ncbi:hypothetical protein FHX42_005213 [Saccharopolyspora lacisalsi]|uniref:Uncharacterized protein n=1 Tax=Halosaccharopolyspora lacisalsi TaxID=1000566 RepID=A0A839E5A6_9PSEU|nr:hypothetical protein [Halosaccharopolyspora lacisalsi]MBA8827806.1 hypothetical protein [Halosaccharopolyspora lacisalsi]